MNSLSRRLLCRLNFSRACFKPFLPRRPYSNTPSAVDKLIKEINDENYELIGKDLFTPHQSCNNVLVIQPYIKWSPNKTVQTNPELQLQESIGLINSVRGWKAVAGFKLPVKSFKSTFIFGSGNVEKLKELIGKCPGITAVFLSHYMLNVVQVKSLEEYLGIPVLDRYAVVLNIFRLHAKSSTSKLQCALAEIPYICMHFRTVHENKGEVQHQLSIQQIARSGETKWERRMKLLKERERKLKLALENIQKKRQLMRIKRQKLQIPSVAVVGYTNCGKTSLIKALTSDDSLIPEDRYFATLDVTVHQGRLLNQMPVLYVDTVGFLSDLPISLIAPFHSTLEDAFSADVLLHVEDMSNPDMVNQSSTVKNTLMQLLQNSRKEIPILTIKNKVDLVTSGTLPTDDISVSATTMSGIHDLEKEIMKAIIESTKSEIMALRVRSGGPNYRWLMKNCPVVKYQVDAIDSQFLEVEVVMSKKLSGQYKKIFDE